MRTATERTGAPVRGPWWRVARDNPAWARASEGATTDAKRKAEADVHALGARLGTILEISEPGTSGRREGLHGIAISASSSMESGPELSVSAAELDVDATVDVALELEQG
jgi:uncharacterized protein YggE